jgi:RecB family exonuclease
MPDLTEYATEEYPLHPSGMQALLVCSWRMASLHMLPVADEGGVAGDTGSAVHKAAAAFHGGKGVADALAVMQACTSEYAKADLQDAAGLFLRYASDARNIGATVVLVEAPIAFSIAPAPEDRTQKAVSVIGTVDQVRQHPDGRLRVWDIKTSKKDPAEVLNGTVYQMAAYCVGASAKLGKRVDPGGVIMPRRYTADASNSPVFWAYPWTYDDLETIMEAVRHAVAAVRNGHLAHMPNDGCRWCHHRSPDLCLPKLKQYRSQHPAPVNLGPKPRFTGADPQDTLPCQDCGKILYTTVEEVWSGADPHGHLKRICASCVLHYGAGA